MRPVVRLGYLLSAFSLLAMFIGHLGAPDLEWKVNQISSYAATAPHDHWITASMLSAIAALAILAWLSGKHKAYGAGAFEVIIPLFAGAAGAGLLVVASFEETARTVAQLRTAGYVAIRQQSFHDAGLLIFFFSSLALVAALGVAGLGAAKAICTRVIATITLLLSPAAFLAMRTGWPLRLGIEPPFTGLKQRVSLFCLWLAIVLALRFSGSAGSLADKRPDHARNLDEGTA